jgi:prophage DNA circulation protein
MYVIPKLVIDDARYEGGRGGIMSTTDWCVIALNQKADFLSKCIKKRSLNHVETLLNLNRSTNGRNDQMINVVSSWNVFMAQVFLCASFAHALGVHPTVHTSGV